MDYSRFINKTSAARKQAPLRALYDMTIKSKIPVISMAPGTPNSQIFPYLSVEIKMKDGTILCLNEEKTKQSLQYTSAYGSPELLKTLFDLQKKLHSPPTLNDVQGESSFDICVTSGAQDGLCKTLEALCGQDDNVIVDEATYTTPTSILKPLGANMLPVECDGDGMKPDKLRELMSKWGKEAVSDPQSDIPRLIYIIPTGNNPTGSVLSFERRKEIYQIATEYNMLILEDDPYYFVQFGEKPPSLLSMDTCGRVIRLDSFSKIISPGLRVGFVSGPKAIITRIMYHESVSNSHACNLAMTIINETISKWGIEGFIKHTEIACEFYRQQRDAMDKSLKKHLTGLAEWFVPRGGLYFWVKILGIEDYIQSISGKVYQRGVLFTPGVHFMAGSSTDKSHCIRVCFAAVTHEEMDKGLAILANVIQEEKRLQET